MHDPLTFDPSLAVLSFHNAADDVWVTVEDEGHFTDGVRYFVRVTHGPEAMPDEDTEEMFTDPEKARARFLELIGSEFNAIMG